MTDRILRRRMAVVGSVLAAAFLTLSGRAAELTLVQGAGLKSRADGQHCRRVSLLAKRGEIVDRSGEPLAMTRETADVYLRPKQFGASPKAVTAIAGLLDVSQVPLRAKAASNAPFVWLKRRVPVAQWEAVATLGLPGIASKPSRARYYPYGPLAGQVLGFVGIDGQGLEGIERQLDADLRGEAVALDVVRDARGRWVDVDGQWKPLPRVGARVSLTIDAGLQQVAERELERTVTEFRAAAASAVVLDARTGEILAMAGFPRFDPNHFTASSPRRWRNRAITDAYEPGSTFKAILAAAAIEAGVVTPDDAVDCENGRYAIGGRTIHDHHPYGVLSFADVIRYSSNIGSAKIAARLGVRRFAAAIRRFGFGRRTGIELPGEVSGILREAGDWRSIDLATSAFGQGLSVTPLQIARAFAAIANGGLLMKPHIVREIRDEGGGVRYRGDPVAVRRVMSKTTASRVRAMLRGVVDEGTGGAAAMDGYTVAGKTGTAQKVDSSTGRYSHNAFMSSFVGFVPAEHPRLVVLVVVDTPRKSHYGGVVAAPAFRRIAAEGLYRLGVTPDRLPEPIDLFARREDVRAIALRVSDSRPNFNAVPSFLGLSMRDALVQAQRNGWDVRVDGDGYVVEQRPAPGVPPAKRFVTLKFGSAVD